MCNREMVSLVSYGDYTRYYYCYYYLVEEGDEEDEEVTIDGLQM